MNTVIVVLIALMSAGIGWSAGRVDYARVLRLAEFHEGASDKVLSISIAQYNGVIHVARKLALELVDKYVAKSKRSKAIVQINEDFNRFPEEEFIEKLNKEVGGDIAKIATKEDQKIV